MLNLYPKLRGILKGRSTVRSHLWQSLSNYVQTGFGVLFGIVLARLLSPEDFGVYVFATSVFATAYIPLNWSLGQLHIAEGADDGIFFRKALSFAWRISLLKALVISCLCAWFYLHSEMLILFVLAISGFAASFHDVVAIHRAECERRENFRANFFNAVLTIVVALGVGIPMALNGFGVYSLAVPTPILVALQMILYKQQTGFPLFANPFAKQDKSLLPRSFAMWVIGACDVASTRLDKIFIGHFAGEFTLGNYSRAFNYAPISHQILASLGGTPTVSALIRRPSYREKINLIFKTGFLLALGGVANWVVVFFVSPWIVPFAFGEQWSASVPFFQAFAGLGLALGINGLFSAVLVSMRCYGQLAMVRTVWCILVLTAFLLALLSGQPILAAYLVVCGLLLQGLTLAGISFAQLSSNSKAPSL